MLSRRLFTVGPVNVEQEVLQSMTRPMITHRSKDYKTLHQAIIEKTKKALDTDMDILMVGGSASLFLEGVIRNGVRSKTLGFTNGSFGDRFIEIAELNGKTVEKVRADWGKAIRAEHAKGKAKDDIEAAHWVSNESSTGVFSDSNEIAEEIRSQNPNAMLFVDAVTSAFAMDLKLRKLDADAVIFGTQKALALPPGLAMVAVSSRLLEKAKTVQNRGFYTDLLKLKKQNDENYALTTPPVSLMYALDFQLDRILSEGMQARFSRHKEMADIVEEWAGRKLHGIFPEKGFRSNSISVLNKGDLDFDKFHSSLKSKGYEISSGYGDVKDRTFRIGHMGDTTPSGVKQLLSVMDEILEEKA
ncbi:MAG: aminotransferase class V-fold PLP-dependent enzyme [Methanomassiliicoccaceae archaeon]|nr:aminotransferase class V-fold PLP-dependent enzyme [Methanomassiliicoccaceae archaeon]